MGPIRPPKTPSTRPRVRAAYLLLAAVAAPIAGCGGGGGGDGTEQSSPGASGRAIAVTIKNYIYEPAQITVPKGTILTFTNRDSTPHTATSKESGAFESGSIDPGKSSEVRLEESGSFAYSCLFHPFMKGTIVVE